MTKVALNREELRAWCAGMVSGAAAYLTTVEQGPSKKYLAFTISIMVSDEVEAERLSAIVNGQGEHDPLGSWRISGYAACLGFIKEVWKYLSPAAHAQANNAIRHYKQHRNGPFE